MLRIFVYNLTVISLAFRQTNMAATLRCHYGSVEHTLRCHYEPIEHTLRCHYEPMEYT